MNSSAHLKLEMIEYPGMVKNVEKMINTLGGSSKISQALGGEQKRLELRYHPENPFNKATFGETAPRAGLLLMVRVRRSKRNPTKGPQYQVRIVGHCEKSVTFESLCDYQFLPLCKEKCNDVSVQQRERLFSALDSLMPQSATDTDYFTRTDMPLMCLPHVFARSDAVHTGILRNALQENGQHEVLGVLQKSCHDNRDVIPFNMVDSFPTRPDPQIVKRMKVKYVSDEQLQKVKKLFEECPIWTRIALLYESGVSNDKLKCITPSLAYYFSTGPWRTLYVRYGYDPRKDFNSRHYQTFDFRLRFRSGVAEFVSNRKETIKKKQENPYESNSLVQDIDYPYLEENKLPRSRQCILRYCDILMPRIQEMLDKIPSPLTGAMCNERTGWLPSGFDSQVRLIVSNCIKDLLRNHYRKEQFHAELDAVENEEQEGEEYEEDSDASEGNDDYAENLDDHLEGGIEDMDIDTDLLN